MGLQKKNVLYYDIWKQQNISNDKKKYNNLYSYLSNNKINNNNNTELIEIDSGFGGIAIYKLSSIPENCKYNGLHENGMKKYEHVDFNRCIKNNDGKIYINPLFITS